MSKTAPQLSSLLPSENAVFYDPENFFEFQWPPVPRRQFIAERDRAFDPATETCLITLDSSDVLQTSYPATTPLLLSRYLRIRSGESLRTSLRASAELHYVLAGSGESSNATGAVVWGQGDAFLLPGGGETRHRADADTIVFCTTNEPLLSFESLAPDPAELSRVCITHWTRSAIEKHLETVHARPRSGEASGRAVQLATARMAPARHPVPSMNVAINSLEPGEDQRPHRHNGVAITLAIMGEDVYSMIEDERVQWSTGAAQITPPTELHSHHNRGTEMMRSLVIQDEGLHFYTRTPGFSWE